jgi:hypothetical protein
LHSITEGNINFLLIPFKTEYFELKFLTTMTT